MIYFDRKERLEIDNNDFSEFKIEWTYDVKIDDSVANLKLTLYNLSKENIEKLKKGSQIKFYFGYENNTTLFFSGLLDSMVQEGGITKSITLDCYEYSKEVFKKISRSYEKGTTSKYVIEDICKQCAFDLREVTLGKNIIYKNGYNVYDMPLIALKKISTSCNSKFKIDGNKIYVYTNNIGANNGIEFDFESGLLSEPNFIQSSIAKRTDEEKEDKERYKKPSSTHVITTLSNPEVKKFDLIKVLGKIYRVDSLSISDWISTMEASLIE